MKTRLDVLRETMKANDIDPLWWNGGYPDCSHDCPRFYTTRCTSYDIGSHMPCRPAIEAMAQALSEETQ